jgi:Holliday junction DNA helicase RuvA
VIGRLRGVLVHREGTSGILDVRGVGYEISAPTRALVDWAADGGEVEVHVHTAVREDAIALYGFQRRDDRAMFRQLITVTGVGPKLALATLDAVGVEGLVRAVETDDVRVLSTVPGIGKKMAQRLALELKGKLPEVTGGTAPAVPAPRAAADPLELALDRLGYSRGEVAEAMAIVASRGLAPDAPVADRLKVALAALYRS